MATVAGIKIKNKAPRVARIAFADEKYTGSEPQWPSDAAEWDGDKFDNLLRKSYMILQNIQMVEYFCCETSANSV